MPTLLPFRGYRYCVDSAAELSQQVTQPYDKISPEARRGYLAQSSHNVAHVISNPNYREAGQLFNQWIKEGVLVQDSRPGFYVYRQTFTAGSLTRTRTGVVGLLDLTSSQAGVLRHENVMDAPLQDRMSLIAATESNDGLIFMLIDDQPRGWEAELNRLVEGLEPVAEAKDEYQVLNQVWRLEESPGIQAVQKILEREKLYIADGHHRFETAIRFAQQCREKNWSPTAVESFDKRMVALFSSRSDGVVILPTHRAIRGVDTSRIDALLGNLEEDFRLAPLADADALLAQMEEGEPGRIGLVAGRETRAYILSEAGAREKLRRAYPGSAAELDVNLLHHQILDPYLGIGEAELKSQKHVDYYRDPLAMIAGIRAGDYQVGFLLNPTTPEQVREVSEEGGECPRSRLTSSRNY